MRRARAAERAAAEQRAAQVGAAAARASDDAFWRPLDRDEPLVEHSRLVHHLQGPLLPLDVELVAGRLLERVPAIGADLGLDAELPQEPECAPRDGRAREVEVERDLPAPAQVRAAGGMEEPRELGEPVAVAAWRDPGELVAELLGERAHSSTPSSASSRRLYPRPSEP